MQYYTFFDIAQKKACFPNYTQKLKLDYSLSNDDHKKAFLWFLLPHSVAFEPCLNWALQFKALNSIPFTKSKLLKIGCRTDNLCSFCNKESETIKHFFWDCPYSNSFCMEMFWIILFCAAKTTSSPNIKKILDWHFNFRMPVA